MGYLFGGLSGEPNSAGLQPDWYEPRALMRGIAEAMDRELLSAPMTEAMFDVLREGTASLHDFSNVAAGHGRNVYALKAKGFMRQVRYADGVTTYKITEAGRKALLAHLGVHEID